MSLVDGAGVEPAGLPCLEQAWTASSVYAVRPLPSVLCVPSGVEKRQKVQVVEGHNHNLSIGNFS